MKTYKILALIGILSIATMVSASAVDYYVKTKAINGSVITDVYFDSANFQVYRFQDKVGTTTTTCYIINTTKDVVSHGNMQPNISCVKN